MRTWENSRKMKRLFRLLLILICPCASAYEVIELEVPGGANEAAWRDALAEKLDGATEWTVKHGRVDVVTGVYAIEVDWLRKHDEGYGQALRYGVETGLKPVVALIVGEMDDKARLRLEYLERTWAALCAEVEVWALRYS